MANTSVPGVGRMTIAHISRLTVKPWSYDLWFLTVRILFFHLCSRWWGHWIYYVCIMPPCSCSFRWESIHLILQYILLWWTSNCMPGYARDTYFYRVSEKNTLRSIPCLFSHGLNCLNFDRSTFQLTQLYLVRSNLKLRLVTKVVKPSWSQQNVGVLVAKSACRTQLGAARCCSHSTAWKWMCLNTI